MIRPFRKRWSVWRGTAGIAISIAAGSSCGPVNRAAKLGFPPSRMMHGSLGAGAVLRHQRRRTQTRQRGSRRHKLRRVLARRNLDVERMVRPVRLVIFAQAFAESMGLHLEQWNPSFGRSRPGRPNASTAMLYSLDSLRGALPRSIWRRHRSEGAPDSGRDIENTGCQYSIQFMLLLPEVLRPAAYPFTRS